MPAERCENCRFAMTVAQIGDGLPPKFYCRRYPPTVEHVEMFGHPTPQSSVPEVYPMSWCGEWQLSREIR